MDNINTLFAKKEYELVLKLTEFSNIPEEMLMRISCFVILGKVNEALDEIEKNQNILEKIFQLKLMKIHFELLLSKQLFDEAKIALKHYENLPYVSQEVEEFMREMSSRIKEEERPKNNKNLNIEDIYEILEKETQADKISEVLFSLKNYNINIYIDSIKIFMSREDVNPNFRTYALLLLVDQKYDDEINFLSKEKILKINPSKLTPPFTDQSFFETCKLITEKANKNTSLLETALHLFNCYIIDIYPENITSQNTDEFSSAILLIAQRYLGMENTKFGSKIENLSKKIQKTIESTPQIKF